MVQIDNTILWNTPYVVILGLYRSGLSCLAGALDSMGVHMGETFHKVDVSVCPTGSYEAKELAEFCWRAYTEPSTMINIPRHHLIAILNHWSAQHRSLAALSKQLAGAKHPLLCAMIPELLMATSGIKSKV